MNRSAPHWKISLYVAGVVAAAWLWFWILKLGLRMGEWAAITVLMWIPGLLSILFRVVFKEGFGGVAWRVGKARFWPSCLSIPPAPIGCFDLRVPCPVRKLARLCPTRPNREK